MHSARIPPVEALPATIAAVLAMHAGHIYFPLKVLLGGIVRSGTSTSVPRSTRAFRLASYTRRGASTRGWSHYGPSARDRATDTCPRDRRVLARRWNRCDRRPRL